MSDHYPMTIDLIMTFDQCGNSCIQNLVITQDFVNNEIETLEANQTIQADNLIGITSDIIYKAGQSIELNSGFEILLNGIFEKKIGDCSSP